jgi:predicted dehydrogenase
MGTLRLAAVGCGKLFRERMLPAILARRDAVLAGLVDPHDGSVEEARQAGAKGAAAFPTVEEALGAGGFDAAYVASPNHLHVPQALALLAAGKHVLVEKPLAPSAAEGERLAAAIDTWYQNGQGQAIVGLPDGKARRLKPEERDPYAAELDHFLSLVRDGQRPDARFSVEGAVQDLRLIDAVRDAARIGRAVRLDSRGAP